MPRLQPISFFSTGSSGSTGALRNSSPIFTCDMVCSFVQLASGGLTPLKNSQEISKPTQITKPNRLYEVDRGEPANSLLPELLEVGEHADREESQDEEHDAQRIGPHPSPPAPSQRCLQGSPARDKDRRRT